MNIMAQQVQDLKPGDDLVLSEQKTGKERRMTMNAVCVAAIENLLASQVFLGDDPVFKSRKGGKLRAQSVHRLVTGWCRQIILPTVTICTFGPPPQPSPAGRGSIRKVQIMPVCSII